MNLVPMLYFDPDTELRLKLLWQRLADEGISSAMVSSDLRPHLSLAGVEGVDCAELRHELAAFAQQTPPLHISLAAVGIFPGEEGVVYIAPVVTSGLLALHQRFHARLEELGYRTIPHYRPGVWVPHCTVAIQLPPDKIPAAVDICCRSDVFGPAQLVEVGAVQVSPAYEVCGYPLQGASLL